MQGKLHLRLSAASPSRPLCGRQLNNHRDSRAQLADRISFASGTAEFLAAMTQRPGVCRHCGRVAGIIPRVQRAFGREEEGEADDE